MTFFLYIGKLWERTRHDLYFFNDGIIIGSSGVQVLPADFNISTVNFGLEILWRRCSAPKTGIAESTNENSIESIIITAMKMHKILLYNSKQYPRI